MKIFNWVQSKLNGRQGSTNPTAVPPINKNHGLQQPRNDEFSDWPHGLLAIGTFGNSSVVSKDPTHEIEQCEPEVIQENPSSSSLEDQEIDFTPEELGKLRKELTKLLSRKPAVESGRLGAGINLPLDQFLNCPSSLEVDRKINGDSNDNYCTVDNELLQRSISVVCSKTKELRPDHSKTITKKSLAFLLKKMFVCSSGFTPAPAPSLRDPIPESRIEKLLRTIINKKSYPRGSAAPSAKKYLGNVHDKSRDEDPKEEYDDQPKEKVVNDGCKWVKTDDEFIVLEI